MNKDKEEEQKYKKQPFEAERTFLPQVDEDDDNNNSTLKNHNDLEHDDRFTIESNEKNF